MIINKIEGLSLKPDSELLCMECGRKRPILRIEFDIGPGVARFCICWGCYNDWIEEKGLPNIQRELGPSITEFPDK